MHDAVVGGPSSCHQQWSSVPVLPGGLCSTVLVFGSCAPTIIHVLLSRAAGVRQVQGLEKLLQCGYGTGLLQRGSNLTATAVAILSWA